MKMSCNGCRVLRKGCSDDCIIRPCLQWIKSSDSQANATLFLAKFYGRAGLLNLIEAGPQHLRPAIFKSLLYEACGRIVNPIMGSVGLMWSGSWDQCQAAVDAVLIKGSPTTTQNPPFPTSSNSAPASQSIIPPLKSYDIRHVNKDPQDPNKVNKTRNGRFKRPGKRTGSNRLGSETRVDNVVSFLDTWRLSGLGIGEDGKKEDESMSTVFSVATVEGFLVNQTGLNRFLNLNDQTNFCEPGLELTLGLSHVSTPHV